MNRFIHLLLGIALTSFTPLSAQVIKLGSLAPEGTPYHQALMEIAQSWKTISGGKVQLRIYPGGIVGDDGDMIRKMRIGQLNGAAISSMSAITIAPDIEAISFPSMIQTDEEMDRVITEVGPVIEQQLQDKGFTLVAWTLAGWVHFFAREPVVTPADMQKQKVFFWGSDATYIELLKRTGFQPVPLPVSELLPALQSGLVDAFNAPPTVALAFQWYGKTPHMTGMRWQPLPGCVLIDNRTWNKIPEAMRAELLASSRKIATDLLRKSRTLEADAIAAMQKNGLTVQDVPESVRQEWISLVQREGYPMFIGPRFSQDIYDRIQAVVGPMRNAAP